jgi:hypothetical protein
MRPDESADRLRAFARANGVDLESCGPRAAIAQMLEFYREVSVEGCIDEDGDMLLFEWGTYDWGQGAGFELGITRQFIDLHPDYGTADDYDEDDEDFEHDVDLDDEDEAGQVSQLRLTLHFAAAPELAALGEGNRWCEAHDALDDFAAFIHESPALRALGARPAQRVEVEHDLV